MSFMKCSFYTFFSISSISNVDETSSQSCFESTPIFNLSKQKCTRKLKLHNISLRSSRNKIIKNSKDSMSIILNNSSNFMPSNFESHRTSCQYETDKGSFLSKERLKISVSKHNIQNSMNSSIRKSVDIKSTVVFLPIITNRTKGNKILLNSDRTQGRNETSLKNESLAKNYRSLNRSRCYQIPFHSKKRHSFIHDQSIESIR